MSPSKNGEQGTPPALPRPSDYEVGYGKPPVNSRFQKGRSGNPKGRPKGAKTLTRPANTERLKEIVLEEAYRMIGVRDGAREVKVPMAQAIVRAMAVNAVKGQQRAQRLFTELLTTTERERKRAHFETVEALFDYKRAWDQELARRAKNGIVAPDPIPHPDQIRIDLRAGTFEIRGPISKEEQADLETWRGYREVIIEGNRSLISLREDEEFDGWSAQEIDEHILDNNRCIEFIDRMLQTGRPLPVPSSLVGIEMESADGRELSLNELP